MKVLPLIKSHYSLGKSIITLEKPTGKDSYPTTAFDLVKSNNLDTLVLVDDNVSGLLQASKEAKECKVKLVFGLRIWITDDALEKSEAVLKKQAKYIIFVKNPKGYQDIIKIWSYASKDGFYYEPRLDFKTLKTLWNEKHLRLVVPFYDSFIHLNSFESYTHVPQYDFTKPTFLYEDNNLPFDDYLREKVDKFTKENKLSLIPAQSIYYKHRDDFIAYLAARCLHNRTTIEKPELNHMGSDEFNFQKWLINEKIHNEKKV
jgi:DNA polymerase-3 subunit alpha